MGERGVEEHPGPALARLRPPQSSSEDLCRFLWPSVANVSLPAGGMGPAVPFLPPHGVPQLL